MITEFAILVFYDYLLSSFYNYYSIYMYMYIHVVLDITHMKIIHIHVHVLYMYTEHFMQVAGICSQLFIQCENQVHVNVEITGKKGTVGTQTIN